MAGGDAGEVAEAGGGEIEIGCAVGMVEDLVDVGKGQYVRQVGNGGEDGIVFLRAHAEDLCADRLP